MEKGIELAFEVVALWLTADVIGLMLKFFYSVIGTIILPFLFVIALLS